MPEAEGGLPFAMPNWSAQDDAPLSLRDISPRKGGRGDPEGERLYDRLLNESPRWLEWRLLNNDG